MFVNDMEILICVRPGYVYFLGGEGATGKTFLFRLLQAGNQLAKECDRFLLLTYDPEMEREDYIKRIQRFHGKLVFADRFHLYGDDEMLQMMAASGITTLVDEKDYYRMNRVKGIRLSQITLKEKCVEVREL